MKSQEVYQLRHAAGRYWLLDMQQDGLDYKKPIELNESAALIWKWMQQGATREKIAQEIQKNYGIPMEQARADTEQFIMQPVYKAVS